MPDRKIKRRTFKFKSAICGGMNFSTLSPFYFNYQVYCTLEEKRRKRSTDNALHRRSGNSDGFLSLGEEWGAIRMICTDWNQNLNWALNKCSDFSIFSYYSIWFFDFMTNSNSDYRKVTLKAVMSCTKIMQQGSILTSKNPVLAETIMTWHPPAKKNIQI